MYKAFSTQEYKGIQFINYEFFRQCPLFSCHWFRAVKLKCNILSSYFVGWKNYCLFWESSTLHQQLKLRIFRLVILPVLEPRYVKGIKLSMINEHPFIYTDVAMNRVLRFWEPSRTKISFCCFTQNVKNLCAFAELRLRHSRALLITLPSVPLYRLTESRDSVSIRGSHLRTVKLGSCFMDHEVLTFRRFTFCLQSAFICFVCISV